MRGITFQQILFLVLVIALPLIEQIIKRRRGTGRSRAEGERHEEGRVEGRVEGRMEGGVEGGEEEIREEENDVAVIFERRPGTREGEISFEGVSAEGRSFDDAVEALPPPPPPPPRRVPAPVVVRAPAPQRVRPAYARRAAASRVTTVLPAVAAPSRAKKRVSRLTARDARRGLVMMEVLGPCVSLRPTGSREPTAV